MRRLDQDIPDLVAQMAAGTEGPVAIAVSGGSDSLGLLHLASIWARAAGRRLLVLTVDHGLRTEAADEARHVADRAQALGHACEILRWSPDRRSQQAARQARHRLIAQAARRAGARLLLLGHTRSDIEETLLMRLARPSTLSGAVGPQPVSASPVWPEGRGLALARPLVAARRAALMDWMHARGESWVSDPGNVSPAYERSRVRALVPTLDAGRLSRITSDAMRLRAVEDSRLAAALTRNVSVEPSGLIEIAELPASGRVRDRFLGVVLQVAAGTARPVEREQLTTLSSELTAGGPQSRLTLGGAWLQRRGERLLLGRDPGEVVRGWQDDVWDGRYVRAGHAEQTAELPFLVRHGVPESDGWREILSARLAHWASTLQQGARFGAGLADAPD